MINQTIEKLKNKLEKFFENEIVNIDHAEEHLGQEISAAVLELLSGYYEQVDRELLEDKAGRRVAGLCVERRNEKRRVLTQLGQLEYQRTYYRMKDGTYCHPVDELAGVVPNQKVSGGISLALVEASRTMSYAKSSKFVTGGQVSRQTVLHKIRKSVPKHDVIESKRMVPVLHIDADEDHVNLQNGKNGIVPLVSVYEGIERYGKRGMCKNIFHYSAFGQSTEEFWEHVLNQIEERYDLEHTKIYLHGDGAAWIKQGLEWLPNSTFVLDRYHKNKALKQLVSGIDRTSGSQYEYLARQALSTGNREQLHMVHNRLLERWPHREKSIEEAFGYLDSNFDAIAIFHSDPEAANGGATEPHVSHILSARLSSRPMGWSKKTLERFVPILAAGAAVASGAHALASYMINSTEKPCTKRKVVPFSLGLPHPDLAVRLPGQAGKVTPLFHALRPFG